ncbi:transglutaminase family protein [Aquimarina sp. SS2-1]|uniref:transglutaminase-like domain-containing protein n=1 Tax=Aquimarina besae TaxID=3342247 RepID=UPI00366EDDB4
MPLEYTIKYKSKNFYENFVQEALWQFLIIPENNDTQILNSYNLINNRNFLVTKSINGYGFETFRVIAKEEFNEIEFEAIFTLLKREVNPFDFEIKNTPQMDHESIQNISFKVDFEPFLRITELTKLPINSLDIYQIDTAKSIFENLQQLNTWTYKFLNFKAEVTDISTTINRLLLIREGVCQDFSHLFIAIARKNGIPSRYVSGYLHQGHGYFGDLQMHAWVECFIPNIGWIGFDPTNNILSNENHIKVAHGKDYTDCPPIKGVIFSSGSNETNHTVQVMAQQQ